MIAAYTHNTRYSAASRPLLWGMWLLYILVAGYTILHHELWADELHSWNIAKASSSFASLIRNIRYEGHPPLWHTLLWFITGVTHKLLYMQLLHWLIAVAVAFLVLFYAPLPVWLRALIPFGYFFLFEYAVLSRNYAMGVLLALLICIVLNGASKYKPYLYYLLLFLLSNVHLLALILAVSLHIYFLLLMVAQQRSRRAILAHAVLPLLLFLLAAWIIMPPSGGPMNMGALLHRWDKSHLAISLQAPLRALIPMPAWWEYHFWNTEFITSLHARYRILSVVSLLLSVGLASAGCYVLGVDRKSCWLFMINTGITILIGNMYPPAALRYTGFIFIGLLVALWLQGYSIQQHYSRYRIVGGLLVIQVLAGFFAISKDIRLPFSKAYEVGSLLKKVPADAPVVTDFWTINTLSAYTNKPFYSLMARKSLLFLELGPQVSRERLGIYPYCYALDDYFRATGSQSVFMISGDDAERLSKKDAHLFCTFEVKLWDKVEGAIEQGSNLYLYRIRLYGP